MGKIISVILIAMLVVVMTGVDAFSKKPNNFKVLYSNNIHGETEPCG